MSIDVPVGMQEKAEVKSVVDWEAASALLTFSNMRRVRPALDFLFVALLRPLPWFRTAPSQGAQQTPHSRRLDSGLQSAPE